MNRKLRVAAVAVVLGVAAPSLVLAGEKKSIGKQEYENNCAVCHGVSGKGDGPYAAYMRHGIPDLTVLSQKNKGVYPFERVYQVIDGRLALKGHGTEEMPIWGKQYRAEAMQEAYLGKYHTEDLVKARILALTEYISTLQK